MGSPVNRDFFIMFVSLLHFPCKRPTVVFLRVQYSLLLIVSPFTCSLRWRQIRKCRVNFHCFCNDTQFYTVGWTWQSVGHGDFSELCWKLISWVRCNNSNLEVKVVVKETLEIIYCFNKLTINNFQFRIRQFSLQGDRNANLTVLHPLLRWIIHSDKNMLCRCTW